LYYVSHNSVYCAFLDAKKLLTGYTIANYFVYLGLCNEVYVHVKKVKASPYSIPSVGPGADPGVGSQPAGDR